MNKKFIKKERKSSAVCIPPRSQTPRYATYRRVKLRGVHPTAESSDEQFFNNSAYMACVSK